MLPEYNIDAQDSNGHTALIRAVLSKDRVLAIKLLFNRANIEIRGNGDETALTLAIMNNDYDMVSLLLFHGASVENFTYTKFSPLLLAVEVCDDIKIVDELIKYGADVFATDINGKTPTMRLLEYKFKKC